jgi:rhamnose transport system permease protein
MIDQGRNVTARDSTGPTASRYGGSARRVATAALRLREAGIVVALAVIILIFSLSVSNFATLSNWQGIARSAALVVVVGVGEMLVVLTRNIDLSVGSVVGLAAYVSADTLAHHHGLPVVVIAVLAIAVGLACGLINGVLVAVGRIPAIIATLGTLAIFRGLDVDIFQGQSVLAYQLPTNFANLASKTPLGIPILAWIAIVVVVVVAAILRWAPWARDSYAIGSGPETARLVGIPVRRRVITAFALSGALAGLGGFVFAAQYAAVDTTAAQGFEITVITAVVIGGVNLFGGSGGAVGAALGAVLVATITDGFLLLKLNDYWTTFFDGVAIVVIVAADALVNRRLQGLLRRRRRAEILAASDVGTKA